MEADWRITHSSSQLHHGSNNHRSLDAWLPHQDGAYKPKNVFLSVFRPQENSALAKSAASFVKKMGLKTAERPPTPVLLDCSPKTLADVLNQTPMMEQADCHNDAFGTSAKLRSSRDGGDSGARLVSVPGPTSSRSSVPAGDGVGVGGRLGERPHRAATRAAPRLASPTAERHLASLLQQLRRERI